MAAAGETDAERARADAAEARADAAETRLAELEACTAELALGGGGGGGDGDLVSRARFMIIGENGDKRGRDGDGKAAGEHSV